MSDARLIALGAECVCGDLILNRVTVGHYRNGQFVITADGAATLEKDVVEVEARVVPESASDAAAKPARRKAEPKAKVNAEPVTASTTPEAAEQTSAAADELIGDLDAALGA